MHGQRAKVLAAAGAAAILYSTAGQAVTIIEGPNDAPDKPLVFNLVGAVRGSDLTSIRGSLNSPSDVDLYSFILSPASFSASTNTTLDTQLFLFDATGFGVCANDDRGRARVTSILSSGACGLTRTAAGLSPLAISAYNVDPFSLGGLIFPDPPFDVNGSLGTSGPTGPGAARPLSSWGGGVTEGGG